MVFISGSITAWQIVVDISIPVAFIITRTWVVFIEELLATEHSLSLECPLSHHPSWRVHEASKFALFKRFSCSDTFPSREQTLFRRLLLRFFVLIRYVMCLCCLYCCYFCRLSFFLLIIFSISRSLEICTLSFILWADLLDHTSDFIQLFYAYQLSWCFQGLLLIFQIDPFASCCLTQVKTDEASLSLKAEELLHLTLTGHDLVHAQEWWLLFHHNTSQPTIIQRSNFLVSLSHLADNLGRHIFFRHLVNWFDWWDITSIFIILTLRIRLNLNFLTASFCFLPFGLFSALMALARILASLVQVLVARHDLYFRSIIAC